MITDEGKIHIKRYLAGYVGAIARSVSFGIGTQSEQSSDKSLQLQTGSTASVSSYYNFIEDRLIFKASVPENYSGEIYEVGIYSSDSGSGPYDSKILSTFDSLSENWINSVTTLPSAFASVGRIGFDSLNHTPASSQTTTDILSGIGLDLSGYSQTDTFILALDVANSNTNKVSVVFYNDSANYFTFDITTQVQSSGYKIVNILKSSAIATGSPTWAGVQEIRVSTQSKSSGASDVKFDALRIESKNTTDPNYVLVGRKVLDEPQTKLPGQPLDIEFSLDINIA